MDKKNLAAYTPPGGYYPPYLSINRRGDQIEVTVRGAANPDGSCGPAADISMSIDQFVKVWDETMDELVSGDL